MLKKSLLIMLLMALFAPWAAFAQTTCPAPTDLMMVTFEEEHWESPLYEGGDPIITYVTIYELDWFWNENNTGVFNIETKAATDDDWTVLATNYHNTYIYVDGPFNVTTQFRVQSVCDDGVSEWVTYTEPSWCSKPINFTIDDQDAYNVIASWDHYGSNYSFNIEVNGVVTENVTSPYTIPTELGTSYTVRVQTVCSDDAVSDWTDALSFTTPTCPAPTYVEIISTLEDHFENPEQPYGDPIIWTETVYELSWYGGADAYNIEYKDASDENWTVLVSNYSLSYGYIITDQYSESTLFRIQSVCGDNVSEWVTYNPCQAPTAIYYQDEYIQDVGYEYHFSWEGGSGIYNLEYKEASEENWTVFETNYSGRTYVYSGILSLATNYEFRVQSVCGSGFSDWTTTSFVTPTCEAPTNFDYYEEPVFSSYSFEWEGGSGTYNLEYKLASEENWTVITTNYSDTFYYFGYLSSGTTYQFRVQSVCGNVTGDWTTITFTTYEPYCKFPENVEVELDPNDATVATLFWTYDAMYHEVSPVPDVTQICLNGDMNDLIEVNSSNTFTLMGLLPETTYTVKMRGDCGDDWYSQWSDEVTFTTPVACQTPTGLYVEFMEEAIMWANVYWNEVPGADSYDLEVNGVVENYTSRDVQLDIAPNTTYAVRVRALCSNGYVSDWTDAEILITPECQPEDRCEFELELTDASGNGWDAGILQVLDIATGDVLLNFPACEANVGNNPASRLVGFYVCTDHEFQLVWNGPTDNMEQYTFEFREAYAMWGVGNGDMICSGNPSRLPFDYGCGVTCRRPTGIAADRLGDNNVELSWYCDSYTEDYNISVNGTVTNNISAYEDIDYPGMFTYTLNGLDANTAYEVKLQAICGDDNVSNWSDPFNFSMETCLPEEMCYLRIELRDSSCDPGFDTESLRVVDVTTGFIIGKFGYSPNVMYCDPEYYSLQVCDGHMLKFISSAAPSTAYYTVVDAEGEVVFSGQGPLSEPGYYTVNCPTCFKPTGLEALEVGRTSALLSWTENGDAESWIVAYNQPDVNNDGYIEVVAESIPFTLEGLVTEATTLVKVRPICSDGEEKWSDVIDFWTPACPDVTNLSVFPSPTSGIVSWDTYPGDEYYVDYALYSDDGTAGLDWNYGSESVTSPYTIDGLEPETQYIVRVRTTCPGYGSTNGVEVLFTTLSEEVVQELTMVAGTNWYTFEVDITLQELQEALVAAMEAAGVTVTASNPIIIKTKSATTKYNGVFWRGNLTSLDANEMYMITLPASGEITLQGPAVIPEETYTIHYGANWIVFPTELSSMSLVDAFTGFAVVGDKIKLKGATATFNGTIWRGNFNTLEPGECYIYISNVDNDRTLVFPSTSK